MHADQFANLQNLSCLLLLKFECGVLHLIHLSLASFLGGHRKAV